MRSFVLLFFLFSFIHLCLGLQDPNMFLPLDISGVGNPHTLEIPRKSLFIQSMERDYFRSQRIASKISLAVGSESAVVHPLGTAIGHTNNTRSSFSVPLVSGAFSGYASYYIQIEVGSPRKKVYMVADTGSDLPWIQCAPCRKCYKQVYPVFNPLNSSTYKHVRCGSLLCKKLETIKGCSRRKGCIYKAKYGDGSFSVGQISTEAFKLGEHSFYGIGMGCGHNNQGLFAGADGICGLDRGPLSLPSQVGYSSFSYCLPKLESKKVSAFSFGSRHAQEGTMYTRLLNGASTMYYVPLTRIYVAGVPVRIPSNAFSIQRNGTGGVILDSGTAITRLYRPVYDALRDSFRAAFPFKMASAFHMFDTCYNLTKSVKVPSMVLEFEGKARMELPTYGILANVEEGMYCFAFLPEVNRFSIVGSVQQQGFEMSIDNANKKLGITPYQCT